MNLLINMLRIALITIFFITGFIACYAQPVNSQSSPVDITTYDTTTRTIHVFVALCDNKYQGIVPVPKAIGNGQDAANNLYWGCAFGIRTFFKNSKEWKLVKSVKIDSLKLERIVFRHVSKTNYYMVADAYNGKYIKQCTKDFLNSCAGKMKDILRVGEACIGVCGNARLAAYIGHDGLMDFSLNDDFTNADGATRNAIILACASKPYFNSHLRAAKAYPLVWTSHLMCPEAYTLHDALTGYLDNETPEAIRTRAAKAYAKYQKCSEKAARGLLLTGW